MNRLLCIIDFYSLARLLPFGSCILLILLHVSCHLLTYNKN